MTQDDRDLIFAEIGALRALMGALINTHPDKPALLVTFDALVSFVQVQGAVDGAAPLHKLARDTIQSYRGMISQP